MVHIEFDEKTKIVTLTPDDTLHGEDFAKLAEMIDPYIAEHGDLSGLIIYTKEFPGWDDFSAMVTHLKFVKEHHKHVEKVALVSDMYIPDFTKTIINHFVNAEVATFEYANLDKARQWMHPNR